MKIVMNVPENKITLFFEPDAIKSTQGQSRYPFRRRLHYFCKGWASLGNVYGTMHRDSSRRYDG